MYVRLLQDYAISIGNDTVVLPANKHLFDARAINGGLYLLSAQITYNGNQLDKELIATADMFAAAEYISISADFSFGLYNKICKYIAQGGYVHFNMSRNVQDLYVSRLMALYGSKLQHTVFRDIILYYLHNT